MAEIRWTNKAKIDLKSIHDFISEDSVFYADRFIVKLVGIIDVLQNFPTSGRIVPEYEDYSIREIIEGNYRIFYKIGDQNVIYVIRIHHAAKKIV